MAGSAFRKLSLVPFLISLVTLAGAQSFRVQCPTSTITHPDPNRAKMQSHLPKSLPSKIRARTQNS